MELPERTKFLRIALGSGVVLAAMALAVIAVRCRLSPSVPFLPTHAAASWIVFPVPQKTHNRPATALPCEFRKVFDLASTPSTAALELRSFGVSSLRLNGRPLAGEGGVVADWKRARRVDVAEALRPGRNELAVVVSNAKGPPALWLTLTAGGATIMTDATWEASIAGAAWTPARDAGTGADWIASMGGTPESTARSLGRLAPWLAVLAAVFAGVLAGARRFARDGSGDGDLATRATSGRGWLATLGLVAVAWLLLFANNFRPLPINRGFDADGHLEYVKYVRERGAIPYADQGWEMYQPPLYYVVAAGALDVAGAAPIDAAGKGAMRAIGLLAGIANFAFIFASVRLLFRGRPYAQLAGGVFGAFVPVHLYLFQYATNEGLSAALISATVYLLLRILEDDVLSPRRMALLGGTLGAALLTKLTALLLFPAIAAALGAHLIARRRTDARAWVVAAGIPIVTGLVVCGWYYVRVAQRFGSPFVGNWDEGIGLPWWQDPGFRVASYYVRFGRALVEPFFAGFHGFFDGLYSTFWGDGLRGGAPNLIARPPWNYDLMGAGYLLALLPLALMAAGLVAGAVALWRRPRAAGLVLGGLVAASALALVFMTLKIPSYAQVKAFYALPAVIPMCAAVGYGFDLVARRWRQAGAALAVGLGVWASAAYGSFWIRAGAPATLTSVAEELVETNRPADAERVLRRAIALDPSSVAAHFWLASALSDTGNAAESLVEAQKVLELDPSRAETAALLAQWLAANGQSDEAETLLRRTVVAAPDGAEAWTALGGVLQGKGESAAAIDALRHSIALEPDAPSAHEALGVAYAANGRSDDAIEQLRYAVALAPNGVETRASLVDALHGAGRDAEAIKLCREGLVLTPDAPPILSAAAWILATSTDGSLRNGTEALQLAERAASTTGTHTVVAFDAPAAAYAELGRFDDAVRTASSLVDALTKGGQNTVAAVVETHRATYASGRPWRSVPKVGGQ